MSTRERPVVAPRHGNPRPTTASEYVHESLRRSILSGEIEAGTRLGLADVAAAFDVSTTPVREALRELAFEGLVHLDSYRGGTVNAISEADVRDMIRIRAVLETMAVEEAMASMTEETLERAEAVLQTMTEATEWDDWLDANRKFHNVLYAGVSRRLMATIETLQAPLVMFVSNTLQRRPNLRREADRGHRAIIDALRAGDRDAAVELTIEHLHIPIREE